MTKKYEAIIVLNTRGKEEGVEAMAQNVGKQMEAEGAKLEQIDHLGRRKFAHESHHLDGGHYMSYLFDAEPSVIDKLKVRLKLNEDVHYHYYQIQPAKSRRANNNSRADAVQPQA